MKKLLKEYDLSQEYEYYDLCYNSRINGNITQSKELFKAMTKKDRKKCYLYFQGFYDRPNDWQLSYLNFFFELI